MGTQLTPHAIVITWNGVTVAIDAQIQQAPFGADFTLRIYVPNPDGSWNIGTQPGGDAINIVEDPTQAGNTALDDAVKAAGGIANYLAAREVTLNQELAEYFAPVKVAPTTPPVVPDSGDPADYAAILAWLDKKRAAGGWAVHPTLGVPQLT